MKDFELESKKEKLEHLTADEQLKMIYMWVKQGNINLKQFKLLLLNILH